MHIPIATYRIQFNPDFTFDHARAVVPYLAELGVSDLYASPIFKARQGSEHGYDVVDPNRLNPDLGSESAFEELQEVLKAHGMSWLQDLVPNHMAYDGENAMLMDVLENGPDSQYVDFFDVDWQHPYERIRGRILAPFLGAFYGECLEDGHIHLEYGKDGLAIRYYELSFPVKIESYTTVFSNGLGKLRRALGREHTDFVKLLGLLYSLKNLPSSHDPDERYAQIVFIKELFWELYSQNPAIKEYVDANVARFNGTPGVAESFDPLDALLSDQFFRLAFWKVGTEELNYRRFFNINELITLRMEDSRVFHRTHRLIERLIRQGAFAGVRIDHVDGLYHPLQYLSWLRRMSEDLYIVVEKILEWNEELPTAWPVQGTTGYDFLNTVNGIFCLRKNELQFDKIYRRFTDFATAYRDLVHEKKRLLIGKHMASDVDNLAHLVARIAGGFRYGSDFTLYGLKRALVEVLALFPVYRTYICDETVGENDRTYIKEALHRAGEVMPDLLHELDFLENLLLLNFEPHVSEEARREWLHFVMRFQQFTGPLMAKGVEDTVLYIYNRLISLNEVGGNPSKFGVSHIEFHQFNKRRAALWPHAMNTTATHDTKRGEDVRTRLQVLTEMPGEWERAVKSWSKTNRRKKRKAGGRVVPESNDEYFLYQTLVGTWPFEEEARQTYAERIRAYIIKAVREAKVHTAWLKPDTAYEDAYLTFVDELLRDDRNNAFLREFRPFQRRVAHYGVFNSLAQTLIKLTAPGVPDFYQGAELWDLSLVDPDNRRPVDYDRRRALLAEITRGFERDPGKLLRRLWEHRADGGIKLFLIYRGLLARRRHAELFSHGGYVPLEPGGRYREQIIAFARHHGSNWAVVVAPRFLVGLIEEGELPLGVEVWDDTHVVLPEGLIEFEEAITGRQISAKNSVNIGELFHSFPGALLIAREHHDSTQ